jgi:hypothetical protein
MSALSGAQHPAFRIQQESRASPIAAKSAASDPRLLNAGCLVLQLRIETLIFAHHV